MTFILPRGAEREYLTVYGVVAVYVAQLPTGEAMFGTSRDLLQSLQAIRRHHAGAAIVCAYWAKNADEAQLVCSDVARDSEGVLMNARTVQARIEIAGDRMNLALTDHETIMTRARMAVEYVEGKIAEAQAVGDLRLVQSRVSGVAARGERTRAHHELCRGLRSVAARNLPTNFIFGVLRDRIDGRRLSAARH